MTVPTYKLRTIVLFIAGLCLGINLFSSKLIAQSNIDPLLSLIKSDRSDTTKLVHLNAVCKEYILINDYSNAISFGKQALSLANNLITENKDPLVLLVIKKNMASSYNRIGVVYMNQGNYPEALTHYFNSLKLFEEIHDQKGIAYASENIGIVYEGQGDFKKALSNFLFSLKIKKEINDKQGIANSLENIGTVYERLGNYTEALVSHQSALKISESINDTNGMANSYLNIGLIHLDQGNYAEALKNDLISLQYKQAVGHDEGVAHCYIDLGSIYFRLNQVKESETYFNKALSIAGTIGSKELIRQGYFGLVMVDSVTGDFKTALIHHKLFIAYRDSINNEETNKKSLQMSLQYEFDKKDLAAKAQQEKLQAINVKEKQKQQIVIFAVCGVLVLVIFFAIFMFNRVRVTQKQKTIIEDQKILVDGAYKDLHEKNKEVMDSITYAHRIQRALITSEAYIDKALNKLNQK